MGSCGGADCPCGSDPAYDAAGDLGWLAAHSELRSLHLEKSATYGIDSDRLANFTRLAFVTNSTTERYVYERIIEKCVRALNMIDSGQAREVAEAMDVASLGLCAEALRRRRV